MAKCWICGTEEADTWRYCSAKKQFVCITCERACANFSQKLLPNGCNCRLASLQPSNRLFKYLANPSEVDAAKTKYESYSLDNLRRRYRDLNEAHKNCDDSEIRAKLRVELTAIYEVAQEKKRGA